MGCSLERGGGTEFWPVAAWQWGGDNQSSAQRCISTPMSLHFAACFPLNLINYMYILFFLWCLWGWELFLARKHKSKLVVQVFWGFCHNCSRWHGYKYHTYFECEEVDWRALHWRVVLCGKRLISVSNVGQGEFRSLLVSSKKIRFVWVGMWNLRRVMLCHARSWGMKDCRPLWGQFGCTKDNMEEHFKFVHHNVSPYHMNEGKMEYTKFGKTSLKNRVSLSHSYILQRAHQWARFRIKFFWV